MSHNETVQAVINELVTPPISICTKSNHSWEQQFIRRHSFKEQVDLVHALLNNLLDGSGSYLRHYDLPVLVGEAFRRLGWKVEGLGAVQVLVI